MYKNRIYQASAIVVVGWSTKQLQHITRCDLCIRQRFTIKNDIFFSRI